MKTLLFRIYTVAFLMFLASGAIMAQDDSEDNDYNSEYIWGINKNTNSGLIGGFVFRYSKALSKNQYHNFGVEIMNVKHEKEDRRQSQFGNFFIFGKQNYLYSIRLQYGREVIFFKKAPQQGVQISGLIAAGPTVGIVAPYYIGYQQQQDNMQVYQQYNPAVHSDIGSIMGTGRMFQGLGDSKIQPGGNIKTSLSFEWGSFKTNVMGLETGFLLEAFPNEIILVPMANNHRVFTSAFITLFYGSRK